MAPFPWFVLLENAAYQALMRSPFFHKGVEQVVKGVHRARFGVPMDELGGTKVASSPRFRQTFTDEIKSQLGRNEPPRIQTSNDVHDETHDAEAAWQRLQGRSTEATQQGVQQETTQQTSQQETAYKADSAWQHAQQQNDTKSFYDILKEQATGKKG